MIELDGVVHVYPNGTRAVDGVSLSIVAGECVAIVGQNGSGKSTLVRHLNGLLRPTQGRVVIDGVDAATRRVAHLARTVGLVFQDPDRQIFAGKVRAEIAFGPRNLGIREPELGTAVAEALAATGLRDDADANPYDLGFSRRKLLSLASILAMRTPIVVLDEPTVHLDIRHQVEVMELLLDLNERDGTTVVAVLHDLNLAVRYFPRIVLLAGGRIEADGAPADVLSGDRIRDVFQVDPSILPIGPWTPTSPERARA